MRFSVWPSPARPVSEILDTARMADADGWFGVWFADHYMPNTGTEKVDDGDTHEAWAILPAIAAVTERVRVGPLVSPTSVHHPAVLANRAASIDHVSNGRFVLGLGAGWQINEHGAYGIELQEPGPRVDRFEEAIEIVRSLLDESRTSFDGTYYQLSDAPCHPKAVQEHLPLLVGTGSPRMLRITARFADEWNTWGTPETVADRTDAMERACDAVGRDPVTMWRSAQALVFLTDDPDRSAKLRDSAPADRALIGSSEQLIEEMAKYTTLGLDELIIPDFTLGRDAQERHDTYRRLVAEVIPTVA
jgi:alkanesulfonate monooxygenase SsuD/methylene tetrahydromethanopterin reductase-like flavin-dependent oxidoreductase (luciferase family)